MNRRLLYPRQIGLLIALLLLAMGMLAVGTAAPAHAQTGETAYLPWLMRPDPRVQNVALSSRLGGQSHAVAVQGSYVYAGMSNEFAVLDITDPDAPQRIAYLILPQEIVDIVVQEAYAYVAMRQGLAVIDIADPAAPALTGSYTPAWGKEPIVVDLAVNGTRAYLAIDSQAALVVLDIANPSAPRRIGEYNDPFYPAGAQAVLADDDYVYVVTRSPIADEDFAVNDGSTLQIVDLSTLRAPNLIGVYDFGSGTHEIALGDGYLLIVRDRAMLVIDISDPARPTRIGSYLLDANRVAYADGYAYLLDLTYGTGDLHILDLADPTQPQEVATLEVASPLVHPNIDIAARGTEVYILSSAGLHVVDAATPAEPVARGFYGTANVLDTAYDAGTLVSSGAALQLVDLSAPNGSSVIGSLPFARSSRVALSGDYAYVGARGNMYTSGGLWSVDLSDADDLKIVGSLELFDVHELIVADDLLYAAGYYGLHIIDISDPQRLRQVGEHPAGATFYPIDLVVDGSYVYFVDYDDGLTVFDVSVPEQPVLVSSYHGTEEYFSKFISVAVSDTVAYIGMESELLLLDISDPAQPVEIKRLDYPWENIAVDIAIEDDRAYLAMGYPFGPPPTVEGGLWVLDISTPDAPRTHGYYIIPAFATSITLGAEEIFLAADGLYILQDAPR